MSPVRMGVLVSVALVSAIGLAMVARSMASGHEPKQIQAVAPPPKPMVRVLVAAHDLAAGDRLAVADFSWQSWPAESVNPVFITDGALSGPAAAKAPQAVKIETAAVNAAVDKAHEVMVAQDGGPAAKLVDGIVREPMLKGEPILEAKVVHAGSGGVMAVELTPGLRAISVPLSAESAAGGFILPGDHVDVVQSRQVDENGGAKHFIAGTVLRNVRVLAIDQNAVRAQKSAAVIGATATLEVNPPQAELVALAKAQGPLTLTLRSYADIGGQTNAGSAADLGGDDAPTVVKVYRNAVSSEVEVSR